MARYIGPSTKIARKFGEPIFGTDKDFEKRNFPPGQHGLASKRKKKSEYGTQLKEKQKVKYTYGLLERQFRNLYEKASRMKGQKGENLIFLLESRLDNIVYRLGIAPTRAAARQLVTHCHIKLNGEVCNIPSAIVKPGDVISVRERSRSLEVITRSAASAARYSWLEFDPKTLTGKYLNVPVREEIPETINEQLIVELYSK
ncbi:MAG: 30S ribosomal protein S4 [Rikenellaceae bacterium]|nr:30S ribosomal protein S4 [Rikenellaceae bacterium]MDD6975538.1 30S ribosomal protein S4 [Bacteroidales bacterium]MDY3894174.1 30S ribosomal protein S4 [Candidatus Cryptobacteroides sp.]MCI6428207.1 30S ribosomal protein S4 [Rikenellaceae bacterium]MDY4480806.1 30S ribosomal protein S4 [Candidatus Cryptobacteroides sp.]